MAPQKRITRITLQRRASYLGWAMGLVVLLVSAFGAYWIVGGLVE
jgi:hypothetical protein